MGNLCDVSKFILKVAKLEGKTIIWPRIYCSFYNNLSVLILEQYLFNLGLTLEALKKKCSGPISHQLSQNLCDGANSICVKKILRAILMCIQMWEITPLEVLVTARGIFFFFFGQKTGIYSSLDSAVVLGSSYVWFLSPSSMLGRLWERNQSHRAPTMGQVPCWSFDWPTPQRLGHYIIL